MAAISPKKKVKGHKFRALYRIITGFFILLWIGILSYFVLYPLWPTLQMKFSQLGQYDPYNIGYNMTVQLAVKLTPPTYEVNEEIGQNNISEQNNYEATLIETVSEKDVKTANLEEKNAELHIASIGVDGPIVDGLSQDSMLRGFWHFPQSSVPGERGNTVIIGHRFHHLPPRTDTFFNLDTVSVGDKIVITMDDNDAISYTVVSSKIVKKNDISVLEQSGDYRLTLITCTPLWTSEKRLVVVAVQDKVSRVI